MLIAALPHRRAMKTNLPGLARVFVTAGVLKEQDATVAIEKAQKERVSLTEYLVKHDMVASSQIAQIASESFGLPLMDIRAMDLELVAIDRIPEKLIRKHNALPLIEHAHRLYVAVADPTNLVALEEFKFHTGLPAEAVIVEYDALAEYMEKALTREQESAFENLDDSDLDALDISSDDELEAGDDDEGSADDAPIVRFVNKILLDAINGGASDIHFEPYEKVYRVRLRVDGVLTEVASPPVNLASRLAARIKVMSRLDISERRIPQDGRFKMKISKHRSIDFRISTCPTLFGEKVVMRILDPTSAQLGIDALGYEEKQQELFLKAIAKPQGMVLVTGPTGSGKTVSLYTALNILNTDKVNISTAEDPVEINIAGLNQVNVNPKAGLTFASALRSFLRQDPDIVMVGEIRDLETAEIAVKAAQTGHLVLSTLHTNSAPETLTRMMNMGIPSYNLATSVSLIIAQRLARKLCSNCKEVDEVTEAVLLEAGYTEEEVKEGITIYKAKGCENCNEGYKGRVGLYEVMPVTKEIGRVIMEGGNAIDIRDKMIEQGVEDLRRSALNKVKKGITSLLEINRVTKD